MRRDKKKRGLTVKEQEEKVGEGAKRRKNRGKLRTLERNK